MVSFNKISDISIAKKLFILFVTVLLGFLATASIYLYTIKNERDATNRTNLFVEYGQLVGEAQKNYFKVRRFEKDFLLSISASTGQTYNNAPLDEHAKHVTLLEGNMEQLRALGEKIDATTTEEVVIEEVRLPLNYIPELVTQSSSVVNDYKTSFSDIVKFNQVVGFTDADGLRQKANATLNIVENSVSNSSNAKLFTFLAKIRSHKKHILQSIDLTESYEDLKFEVQSFKKELNRTSLSLQKKIEIENYLNDYLNIIDDIVTNKRNANEYTELYDFMLGPMFDEMGQSSQFSITQNQAQQEKSTGITTAFALILLLAISGIVVSLLLYFANNLKRPIDKLLNTIHAVNDGDLEARVGAKRKDEFGELSMSFDKLLDEKVTQLSDSEKEKEQLNDSVIDLIRAVAQLSKKDFTVKVPVNEDVTGAVGDSLNLLTKETSTALNNVKRYSIHVASVSNMLAKQANLIMAVAEEKRGQVDTTVDMLNKSSSAMNKISSDAVDANNRADQALNNTRTALDAVNKSVDGINSIRDTIRETEKRIKRLGERSQEITGIVNLINSIAERTHILALNASMHAASAGEAGRGFAVVADEVQRLAESAREATTEIDGLVNNIHAETTDTVTAMNHAISQVAAGTQLAQHAGDAMKQTQTSTEDLVKAVAKITQSSKAQADESLQLVHQSNEIAESTRTTDKHLKQQTNNTTNLVRYSNRLLSTVKVFKLPESENNAKVKNVESKELKNVLEGKNDTQKAANA